MEKSIGLELLWALAGTIWTCIGDETCTVNPDQTAIIPPSTRHCGANPHRESELGRYIAKSVDA
jgi:mannose-6-phosphate isomerase-like protein (cupin superfamily)